MYEKFACCAFWASCKLGQLDCVYKQSNPAKMKACGAFQRGFSEKIEVEPELTTFEPQTQSADGQLTLF